MPRKRNAENKGLPSRWRYTRNAYYFQVPTGLEHLWDGKKTYKLGSSLPEAYRVWAEKLGEIDKAKTIGDLLDRYALEVIPTKKPATQRRDNQHVRKLRAVFGTMPIGSLTPQHIYLYNDKRKKKSVGEDGKVSGGATTARHEIALLKHAYTKAVEWGYLPRHPFKGEVRLEGLKPRERYIEDWEVTECLSLPSKHAKGSVKLIQAYMRLKLLTGLRKSDLLKMKEADLKEDGIHVQTSKTGKARIYEWTPALRKAVTDVKASRAVDISPFLFCTKRGKSYLDESTGKTEGWDSMWQRFMARVLSETKVSERFTEHDLRAKCASDAESLERAQQLLAHTDSKVTQSVYRRKPERIMPSKSVFE